MHLTHSKIDLYTHNRAQERKKSP